MLSNKKGSALLIVIGFLSFMIISAVAFSIYMRAERLPSSALRRTVATRQLAKAALAEAIAQVDDMVRGSPFPGLPDSDTQGYLDYRGANGECRTCWEGRVFAPPTPDQTYTGNERHYAPAPLTVSVLTLEAMGYVPAPLVNDVRFLGRSTWSAAWHNLPYDAGRFAFVALNVSDFFDVNRMYADKPRTANALGRISLAYLLDPNFRPMAGSTAQPSTSVDGFSNTKQFDDLLHGNRDGGNDGNAVGKDAPFVSVLDFQLAFKNGIANVMPSFFYDWINSSQSGKMYYNDATQIANAGRQPFVTDSCSTNEAYDVDIAYYKAPNGKKQNGQPFDKEVAGDDTTFMVANSKAASSKFFTPLTKQISTAEGSIKFANGLQALSMIAGTMFDYLDHNDVPLSLAWPCVERVPSIVSIEPAFKINIPAIPPQGDPNGTQDWYFDANQWLEAGMLGSVWTFPFKRNENDRNDKFKAQAILRVFLAPEGLTLRAADGLGAVLRPQKLGDWTAKSEMFKVNDLKDVFCLTFNLGEQQINLKSNVLTDNDAGGEIRFPVNIGALGNLEKRSLVTCIKTKDKEKGTITKYKVNVSPLGLDGKPMFEVGKEMEENPFNDIAKTKLRPYVAVWVRVLNGDDKTVDLVPATIDDDKELNSGNSQVTALSEYLIKGTDGPLLRFTGDKEVSYGALCGIAGAAAASGAVEWSPKVFCALDPRFNWAPEDWYGDKNNSVTTFQQWLQKTNDYLDSDYARKTIGCDSDIFLAVSNMGYLQSLGEFSFLPRLTDIYNSGVPLMAVGGAAGGYDGVDRWEPKDIANTRCAWTGYGMSWEVYSALEAAGIGRSSSSECLVNPYSPNWEILMAALANTPCDYWATGAALVSMSNDSDEKVKLAETLGDQDLPKFTTADVGVKYAFCENKSQSGQSRFRYQDLENIAKRIHNEMRNADNLKEAKGKMGSQSLADAWKWIWDEKLNWWTADNNYDANQFLGVKLDSPLYDIDRKFLYSYWRDCFANQQQLFLIFVRAESSALGGPGEGTPAQKGARAVALVWRNPMASTDGGDDGIQHDQNHNWYPERRPHQTRVLFYHQFD